MLSVLLPILCQDLGVEYFERAELVKKGFLDIFLSRFFVHVTNGLNDRAL